MEDLKLVRTSSGLIDIAFENGDMVPCEGVETSVLLSLCINSGNRSNGVARLENSVGGYWGDAGESYSLGSKLYEHGFRNETFDNVVKSDVEDALKWMVDDGIISGVECSVDGEDVVLKVLRPEGDQEMRFSKLWEGTNV